MKNLLFTAFAIFAFSGISMASTVELETEFEKKNAVITPWHFPQELIDKLNECGTVYQELKEAYSDYPNQETVEDLAFGAFYGCMQ